MHSKGCSEQGEAQHQPEARELTTEEFLTKLFNRFDSNSDGRLSSFEFNEALRYLTKIVGVTMPHREDVESVFNCLDADSDRTITREEFKQMTQSFEQLIHESGIKMLYRDKV